MPDWQDDNPTAQILGKYLDITLWILCKSHVSCVFMHSERKRGFQVTVLFVMYVGMPITVSISPEWFWSNFVWDAREIIPA
jgi:hypothetical protein